MEEPAVCRICHCGDDCAVESALITPCRCSGSLRFVHHYCLQQWIRASNHRSCELCHFHFKLHVKSKPFHRWQWMDASSAERRKLALTLLFNLVSMACVLWSLFVLLTRATHEARFGALDWPFWTKMLVVAVGVLGCVAFACVQLRHVVQMALRWRQYNRVIEISNAIHAIA